MSGWTENHVKGRKRISKVLTQPYIKHNFYRDMFVVVFPTPGGELYSLGEILAEVTSNGGIIDWKLMSGGIWPEGVGFTPAANRYCSPLKVELTRLFTVRSMMIYGFPAGSDENKIRLEYSENNRLAERFKPANVVLYADN